MVARPYDMLFPLHRGAVDTPGFSLRLDHSSSPDLAYGEHPPPASEFSLGRYTMLRASGDDRWVGLPVFLLRGFRHGTYLVPIDSDIRDLTDLKGRRVGITGWFDTGNVWARAALRDRDVDVDDVEWWTTPVDPDHPHRGGVPPGGQPMPESVRSLDPGQILVGQLLAGELDAVTTAAPRRDLSACPEGLRRLLHDHRSVEVEYLERTHVYPAFHIAAVRRDVRDRDPSVVTGLYESLRSSWDCWWRQESDGAELIPWKGAGIRALTELLGSSVAPYGVDGEVNRSTVETLCREQWEQGLIGEVPALTDLFPDFC